MIIRDVMVKCSTGLHARPATLFIKKASSFKSDVNVEFNGKKANAKSLISILSLGVTRDSMIKIITSGNDEQLASEELVKLIESLED